MAGEIDTTTRRVPLGPVDEPTGGPVSGESAEAEATPVEPTDRAQTPPLPHPRPERFPHVPTPVISGRGNGVG
ncbi:MAG: hypothetical protein AAFQ82_25725, partial [Myxococcota bacterium]